MVCAVPRVALASPTFPDEIARVLDTPCVPQCVLCHTTNLGGYGTAVTPFAAMMVVRPPKGEKLQPAHTDTVAPALAALEAQYVDSDHDGVIDVDELRAGTNPNGDAVALCSDIGYGCAHVASRGSPSGFAFAAALLAFGWLARRRRGHRE
jgi:uncharacterized protein (TIGR03382 family)